jgi:predicted amidohydrolase
MEKLSITLLQADLHWEDPEANRRELGMLIASAAENSDLILLPETFTTGFTMNAAAMAEAPHGPTEKWLLQQATQLSVDICGSLIVEQDGNRYNRLLWASASGEVHSYDKRHLFRMGGEFEKYTHGRERLIVDLNGWRVCPMICYDLRFPVWSRNRGDYDLLLYVANWPESRMSAWDTLLPARAVENLCYVAGVNRTGKDGNGVACGGSSIITDYLGTQLAVADDQPAILRADLSMDKLLRYREKFPAWKDTDQFEISAEPPAK